MQKLFLKYCLDHKYFCKDKLYPNFYLTHNIAKSLKINYIKNKKII